MKIKKKTNIQKWNITEIKICQNELMAKQKMRKYSIKKKKKSKNLKKTKRNKKLKNKLFTTIYTRNTLKKH